MTIEQAIRSLIIFPAKHEPEQPGVAYGSVEFNGRRYNVQYSKARLSDTGIHLYTDDGHQPNSDLHNAMSAAVGYDLGEDWKPAVELTVTASGAEHAIQRSETP